jgi:hypothetical protein
MSNKLVLCIGTIALSAVAMAGSKNYDVVVTTAMKAGSVELAPGDYKLTVEGSNAVFTDSQTHKSLSVPVKVENGEQKYAVTTLDTSKRSDGDQITSIELGGSKTKLEFGQ